MAKTVTGKVNLDTRNYEAGVKKVAQGEKVVLRLLDNIEKASDDLSKDGKQNLKAFSDGLGDVSSSAAGALKPLKDLASLAAANPLALAAAGAIAAGTALVDLATDAADTVDQITKLAEATGQSAETLSRYQQLAEKSLPSGNIEKVAEAFQRLALTQEQAADGSQTAIDRLEALGITSSDTEEAFLQLADASETLGNSSERSAALTELFGDGLARELVPALAQGRDAIEALREENDRLGRSFSQDQADQVSAYKDTVQELEAAWQGFSQTVGLQVIPAITEFLGLFTESQAEVEFNATLTRIEERFNENREFQREVQQFARDEGLRTVEAIEVFAQREFDAKQSSIEAEKSARQAALNERLAGEREAQEQLKQIQAAEKERLSLYREQKQAISERRQESRDEARETQEQIDALVAVAQERANEVEELNNGTLDSISESFQASVEASTDSAISDLEHFASINQNLLDEQLAAELEAIEARRMEQAQLYSDIDGFAQASAGLAIDLINTFVDDSEKAAKAAFLVSQAAAASSVVLNTIEGITQAFTLPPPADGVKIAAVSLAGAASLAAIAGQTFGSGNLPNITLGNTDPAAQAASSTPSTGPGAQSTGLTTTKPTEDIDATFTDTPGPVSATSSFRTFSFDPGDLVVSSKSESGLAAQLGFNNQAAVAAADRTTAAVNALARALRASTRDMSLSSVPMAQVGA